MRLRQPQKRRLKFKRGLKNKGARNRDRSLLTRIYVPGRTILTAFRERGEGARYFVMGVNLRGSVKTTRVGRKTKFFGVVKQYKIVYIGNNDKT